MAVCKFCGQQFQWGRADDKWIPLQLIGEEGDVDRTHIDENGVLRAAHKAFCTYASAVAVVRLTSPVPAGNILPVQVEKPELVGPLQPRKRRPGRRKQHSDD